MTQGIWALSLPRLRQLPQEQFKVDSTKQLLHVHYPAALSSSLNKINFCISVPRITVLLVGNTLHSKQKSSVIKISHINFLMFSRLSDFMQKHKPIYMSPVGLHSAEGHLTQNTNISMILLLSAAVGMNKTCVFSDSARIFKSISLQK